MMSLRRESEYAIRLLKFLSRRHGVASLQTAAKEIGVSFLFLQKIARKLRQANLIKAEQGILGGYVLVVRPAQLTVKKILAAMGEGCTLLPCLDKKDFACSCTGKCRLKTKLGKVNALLFKMLDKIKLSDL